MRRAEQRSRGSESIRTPSGFGRLSTEEELSQVLAVLQDFSRSGWMSSEDDSIDLQATTDSSDTVLDNSPEADCLAEIMERKPTLKN